MKSDKHNKRHVTPAGRSVFNDLFSPEEAADLEIRATLLLGLQEWVKAAEKTQVEIAKQLGITQARVSDIKRGKLNSFSLDLLIKIAARAGLRPRLELVA